jgi:hypothetical protein
MGDRSFTERPAPATYAERSQVSVDMRETGYPSLFTDALQTCFRSQGLQCMDEQFRTLWKRHYRLRLLDPIARKDIVPDVDFWSDVFGNKAYQ